LLPPGGTWQVVQAYSTASTFTWSTTGRAPGSYLFSVWVRDASRSVSYDTYSAFTYTLAAAPCTSMTASPSPSSPASIGTTVTISAAASGCPSPRYQFWLLPPGGNWTVLRAYALGGTFTWNTTGKVAGNYLFSVWARDASSSASYDIFQAFQYTLTVTPCTGVTASATPSTAVRGSVVTISGAASGCANPRYAFWILPPGGNWTLLQAYGPSDTLIWNTTNKSAGTYRFAVWARDLSSPGTSGTPPNTYDAVDSFLFTLT
jgi:guanyl-specific ribonuclease Sa